jgi:hypothetical protein
VRPRSGPRAVLVAALLAAGCGLLPTQAIHPPSAPPTPAQMAEFWVDVDPATRDLFWGAGGRENAPDPAARYEFVERSSGTLKFSRGFDVKDARGIKWSTKFWPEAQSEVVVSRLMWGIGYHQPPTYYVPHWTLSGDTGWAGPQGAARFRPTPRWIRKHDANWDWHDNPFVGTQPWRGALVMMSMVNNPDLKPSQNTIYELEEEREGARRWYAVRDLGLSLGETGALYPKRNDIGKFEKQGFVKGVKDGRVRFDYSGRWKELFRDLTPGDVHWLCERLSRLTPQQWRDAFRAGGYAPEVADRFIRKILVNIEDAQAFGGTEGR